LFRENSLLTDISSLDISAIDISVDDIAPADILSLKETHMPKDSGHLSEAMFYILIALAQPKHGYAITKEVTEMSRGRVKLGPGTLYGALTSMTGRNWIARCADESNSRRKAYQLTAAGIAALSAELARLEEISAHGSQALAIIQEQDR
jgi:DNA-binding PadR family transcriptional regulator